MKTAALAALAAVAAAFPLLDCRSQNDAAPLCEAAFADTTFSIDGSPESKDWTKAKPATILAKAPGSGAKLEVEIKALHDADSVYIQAKWPAAAEKRSQSRWRWDAGLQIYTQGEEAEEAFSFVWRSPSPKPRLLDVWVWRAGRTDPAGSADDMFASIPWEGLPEDLSTPLPLQFDEGAPCWTQSHYGDFAGETLPRFVQRTPSGSAGDLKAKGRWAAGLWTLEISRKKRTGHLDDLEFKDGAELLLAPVPGRPEPTAALLKEPFVRVKLAPRQEPGALAK